MALMEIALGAQTENGQLQQALEDRSPMTADKMALTQDLWEDDEMRTASQERELEEAARRYEALVRAHNDAIANGLDYQIKMMENDDDSDVSESNSENRRESANCANGGSGGGGGGGDDDDEAKLCFADFVDESAGSCATPERDRAPPRSTLGNTVSSTNENGSGSKSGAKILDAVNRLEQAHVRVSPQRTDLKELPPPSNTSSQSSPSSDAMLSVSKTKSLSFRSVRKQAARMTGIHGLGRKASTLLRSAEQENTSAAREEVIALRRSSYSEVRTPDTLSTYSSTHLPGDVVPKDIVNAAFSAARCGGDILLLKNILKGENQQHIAPRELLRDDGWSLVHSAAEGGNAEVLRWLLGPKTSAEYAEDEDKMGRIDLNVATTEGWTPAHVAAAHGQERILDILSDLGSSLDMPDNTGSTPLHSAAASGHCGALRTLANHGCNLDALTLHGATAAYVAAGNGKAQALITLTDLGADINIPTRDGWSPAQIAHEFGHTNVLNAISDIVAKDMERVEDIVARAEEHSITVVKKYGDDVTAPPSLKSLADSAKGLIDDILPPAPPGKTYRSYVFTDGPLGFVIMPAGPLGDEALVVDVVDMGQADKLGVQVEDICVGITTQDPTLANGEVFVHIKNHDDAAHRLPHVGRPVMLTFMGATRSHTGSSLKTLTTTNESSEAAKLATAANTALTAAEEPSRAAIDMANTSEQQWSCHLCTFANEFKQQQCTMCGTSRKSQDDVLGKEWECPRCTYRNSAGQKKCELCHQEAPTRPFDDYEDTSVNAGGGGGVL